MYILTMNIARFFSIIFVILWQEPVTALDADLDVIDLVQEQTRLIHLRIIHTTQIFNKGGYMFILLSFSWWWSSVRSDFLLNPQDYWLHRALFKTY